MGRQLQLATTQIDEIALLRFIETLSPIRVFKSCGYSIEELWVTDWGSKEIPCADYSIWPQQFAWTPEYRQTGGPNCPPESVGYFYVSNSFTAPILQLSKSFLSDGRFGRIYWARDFVAPHGLNYDDTAFSKFVDSIWRWIRKVAKRQPGSAVHSPYFLPDAWLNYGERVI